MAVCGFCKQKVEFKGALTNYKKQFTKKGSTEGNNNIVLVEMEKNRIMYYCPHCDSVLGFHS